MWEVLKGLKCLFKVSKVHIDNEVFRLHHTFTVLALMTFCIIVTTKQYVGNPIHCTRSDEVPEDMINTFCWIQATYSISTAFKETRSNEIPYPGVDSTGSENEQDFRYHKYYQWVCFMLFFQAVLFYVPRWLWRSWEKGKIEQLIMNLDVICSDVEKKQKELLVDYLTSSLNQNDWYAVKYFVCEVVAFVNVVSQMFLMNKFFGGEFLKYGTEVLRFANTEQRDRSDPMIRMFPRMTKCKFLKYGPSGEIERHDSLCLLPLNAINEKIFIFLWFWFIALAVLTGLVLGYRIVLATCPAARIYVFYMRFRFLELGNVRKFVRRGSYGDWFLLYMLGLNLDTLVFKEVLSHLDERIPQPP